MCCRSTNPYESPTPLRSYKIINYNHFLIEISNMLRERKQCSSIKYHASASHCVVFAMQNKCRSKTTETRLQTQSLSHCCRVNHEIWSSLPGSCCTYICVYLIRRETDNCNNYYELTVKNASKLSELY
jgi:hypothetical protein